MRMSRFAVLPVIAGVAVALAGCNDKGAAGSPPSPPPDGNAAPPHTKLDLCRILTLERAKQLIGDDATPGEQEPTKCSYNAEARGYSVTADYELDDNGQSFELSRKVGGQADKVDGVGDDAFYRSFVSTLYVRKGTVDLEVQIVGDLQGQAVLDAEKKLAGDILK
jgi:hypothetical protein